MAERLQPVLSRIDALKRQLYDALTNPRDYASMLGGRIQESGQAAKQLQSQAFADPRQPFKVTDEAALRQLTDMMMAGPLGFAPAGIVSPYVVRQFKMPTSLPQDETFIKAVQNTSGAQITDDGLLMKVQRSQKPEQAGEESVRTGVFYLPEGSASAKHYKQKKSGETLYGGQESISGETLYKNPLFVKGATGGKAPEVAYDQLVGKGAYEEMRKDALRVRNRDLIKERGNSLPGAITPDDFLAKYAPELEGMGDYIFSNSRQGNQLAYALQEAVVANAVRKAGFDAVLGYSQTRSKDPFLSEVFDVREATYPTKLGEFTLRQEFQSLLE